MGTEGRAGRLTRFAAPAILIAIAAAATGAQAPSSGVPDRPDDRTIVHVLNRIGFGPSPGDVERVRAIGLAAYIDRQLKPSSIADTAMAERLAGFTTLTTSARDLARNDLLAALMQQKLLRAVHGERQLEEVMVDFWFNHFNVFAGKGPTRLYVGEYERDTIRPHALGRFRDLLGAVAESPAMLFYLDNWQSTAPEVTGPDRRRALRRPFMPQRPAQQRSRGINENYARELMELHTLGVDGGYTQKDVQEVARAFTGWTIEQPRQGGPFRFEPRMHDNGAKTVLGVRIRAGGGKRDGDLVLDVLAKHPSTARFISTKLVRRFVADVPPASLVDRAAERFRETDGDIREVVRTIVTSPEFFSATAYRSKVKTPLEFVASAVRATGIDLRNGMPAVQALRQLGMPPYMCQPPTGYADTADAWVNTGALLNRMNFAVALSSARPRDNRPVQGGGADRTVTQDRILREVLAADVSPGTRDTVARATSEEQRIALLLGSPDFQRR